MKPSLRRWLRFDCLFLIAAALFPFIARPGSDWENLGSEFTTIFIFAILALGLNVVVGYTGLLHLGIAAFFGIGAYITGILTVPSYPFQVGFTAALILSALGAALAGVVLGAPTLRLRGDYVAIVTLGFGEVTRYAIRNLEEITAGTRGLNPVPPPAPPDWVNSILATLGFDPNWMADYRLFYYLTLGLLALVIVILSNLEHSRLGRAWVAIREDELAASCMGINAARVKLSAFALGAALAGMAGCLYATSLTSTADPEAYNFNRSVIMLCCIILGGLGSLRGTLLGVTLLVGFDKIFTPWIDQLIQQANINPQGNPLLTFSNWRLLVFGVALVLMMRFRPEGLLPSSRVKRELHEGQGSA
jgi:branched-chain amino acid transport system permease protein